MPFSDFKYDTKKKGSHSATFVQSKLAFPQMVKVTRSCTLRNSTITVPKPVTSLGISEPKDKCDDQGNIKTMSEYTVTQVKSENRNDDFQKITTLLEKSQKMLKTKDKNDNLELVHEKDNQKGSSSTTDSYDIVNLLGKSHNFKDQEIYDFIKNVFVPEEGFRFPKGNGRSFRIHWLKEFSWLTYSPSLDGAFCLCCVLFSKRVHVKTHAEVLVSKPLVCWTSAHQKLKQHAKCSAVNMHGMTSLLFSEFCKNATGKKQSIDVIASTQEQNKIKENRKKLIPIIDTCLVLGRCGLSYRGHRDDSQYHPEVGDYSVQSVGNFIELLNYRVRGGDKDLEKHMKNCAKNATYISKTSQNQIIECIGEYILDVILKEVRKAKYYSIIADEARDCSNKEQMSLILRYISNECEIKEDFVGFVHCESGLTGEGLADILLDRIKSLKLDIKNCRGQGYDGAGNVSGSTSGLAARVLSENKMAIYTHCASHRLNLCIAKSCSVLEVKNVMEQIQSVTYFFAYSETREKLLTEMVKKYRPDVTKKKLIDVCRTRWVSRVVGLENFEEFYVPLVLTFEIMFNSLPCGPYNSETRSKASSLHTLITSFKFIATLVIVRNILSMTLPVTKLLQAESNDIVKGLHLVSSLRDLIACIREDIDSYHAKWYEEALKLANEVQVYEVKPRTCLKQKHRSNVPAETASDYFKRKVSIPVLDHLVTEFNARFSPNNMMIFNGLNILPEVTLTSVNHGIRKESWKQDFKSFSNFYVDDLPSPLNLDSELDLWEKYSVSFKGKVPDTISSTLKSISFPSFENILVCLKILGTLPVTSCTCERSFSGMRQLKTYLRSTMVNERMNGLALMKFHLDIIPDKDEILNMFAQKGNHILDFI